MANIFQTKIKNALANSNLQIALDNNALNRMTVHQKAWDELPDAQGSRKRAHAVRADVIANLSSYLEKFIQQVQANGIIVHRAADAEQAVQIILDIAAKNQAKLIAKSKTMVSEEIELNKELEANQIRVVETDLGEFIVQLRGERPGHIITPAVHLRRAEVGQTFHEKLGIPLTEDIPILTNTARKVLREAFLTADIGLSGVNFGVVETGTLCVFTNEGNGRMVTTVPEIHIALMGIERIVPTLDDLALMMSLLPRSSTGQKLTVYVSMLNTPRQEGDPEGPQERHLVLVDNGRTAVQQSPLAEALYCIRCGACLNACPIFREIGGHAYVSVHGEGSPYSGPIGSVISPGLFGVKEFGHLARASSLCGACKDACPVEIDLPKLLLRVRAGGDKIEMKRTPRHVPFYLNLGLKFFTWMSLSARRFYSMQKLAGSFSRLISPVSGWLRLPAFTGWGYSKDFPRPAMNPFRAWMLTRTESAQGPLGRKGRQVAEDKQALPVAEETLEVRLQRFETELKVLEGTFIRCQKTELPGIIQALLSKFNATKVLAWENLPAGLTKTLLEKDIDVCYTPDPLVRVGITGVLMGVAETATLVLPGGPGRMLSASLLPEIHIALVEAGQVVMHMEQALQHPDVRSAPALALVTGPSRTADIEMTLTIGVHGPTEVYVVCVE
jgi:L-lactate dehydrogenase complex protein LldF